MCTYDLKRVKGFMWIGPHCRKIPTIWKEGKFYVDWTKFLQFERCGLNQGVGKFLRFERCGLNQGVGKFLQNWKMWIEPRCRRISTIWKEWKFWFDQIVENILQFERCVLNWIVGKFLQFERLDRTTLLENTYDLKTVKTLMWIWPNCRKMKQGLGNFLRFERCGLH